jgi:hypothetical protein
MTDFRRCKAIKANGERCKRLAQDGSDYCYNHRHCQPRKTEPKEQPALEDRLKYNMWTCADCGRFQPPGEILVAEDSLVDGGKTLICWPCFNLRRKIEQRILDICSFPGGLPPSEVHADLERFGIEKEMVEAARLRMRLDGRLVTGRRRQ